MWVRRFISNFAQGVAFLVVVALVLGSLLGQPVLLGYVTSGSMQPTMDAGDAFVAIPAPMADQIQEGDVVVFRAQQVNHGELTTHRVVDVTDQGYITKGDNNPITDQAGGEPPVKEPQIVAKAFEIGGEVIVIPHLGTLIETIKGGVASAQRHLSVLLGTRSLLGPQGLAYLTFGVTSVIYLALTWRDRESRTRNRRRRRETGLDVRLIVGVLTAVLVLSATAAMVAPAGPLEFGIVSAEFQSPGPQVIPTGETETATYTIPNDGFVPVITYLEPGDQGIEVRPDVVRVGPGKTATATVTLHAPPETGYYRRYLVEHRYLAILPQSIIRALYNYHPWAPIVAIDALIGIPFYLIGVRLVGTGRLRSRTRDKPSRLRRLYSRLT